MGCLRSSVEGGVTQLSIWHSSMYRTIRLKKWISNRDGMWAQPSCRFLIKVRVMIVMCTKLIFCSCGAVFGCCTNKLRSMRLVNDWIVNSFWGKDFIIIKSAWGIEYKKRHVMLCLHNVFTTVIIFTTIICSFLIIISFFCIPFLLKS